MADTYDSSSMNHSGENSCDQTSVQAQQRKQTGFLDLPRELRDIIYHLCSAHSSPAIWGGHKLLCRSLLFICRTIREEASPVFWAGHVQNYRYYWQFGHLRVNEIATFCTAMRPYTTATPMRWSARVLNESRRNELHNTRSATGKALQSVFRQKANGNELLHQLERDRKEHFDKYLEHGKTDFSAGRTVCGIAWKWRQNGFSRLESIDLRGPLAQLDWEFIASGKWDH